MKLNSHKPESLESPYAKAEDFCHIFSKDMNRLYLLSIMLTGGHAKAEECFAESLEGCMNRTTVFREWAESWARRKVIQTAITMLRPRFSETNSRSSNTAHNLDSPEIAAVAELPAFDRFVFVMSVLEGYSVQECSILLNSTRREVKAVRARALEQLGKAASLRGSVSSHSEKNSDVMQNEARFAFAFAPLARTA